MMTNRKYNCRQSTATVFRSTAVLREGLAHASYEFKFTLHAIPVYLRESGFSNCTSNLAVNRK